MLTDDAPWLFTISTFTFLAVFIFVGYAWPTFVHHWKQYETRLRIVLNQRLLMDIQPRVAMILFIAVAAAPGLLMALIGSSAFWFFPGVAIGAFIPPVIIRHLETKRQEKLEQQLVDGITTLASGVRAGLNLIQSIELLVRNSVGPIRQEFAQLLREYQMGLDLNQAMRNAANRIGLQNYRLLFTAIEMHRLRGGDAAESLDRIAESIREIQRLEGKLDAVTAQGRTQARMMAIMPIVIIAILFVIIPDDTRMLFTEPIGRLMLLMAGGLIAAGFLWIRRIMAVDI